MRRAARRAQSSTKVSAWAAYKTKSGLRGCESSTDQTRNRLASGNVVIFPNPLHSTWRVFDCTLKARNRPMRNALYALLVTTAVIGLGCSGEQRSAPADLHAISGTVTLNGTPVEGVSLKFIPDHGTTSLGGYAASDQDGHFEVKHLSNTNQSDGLEAGTYQVVFSKLTLPNGSPIPDGQSPTDAGAIESLPPHLSKPAQKNPLHTLKVDAAKSDVEFHLKSKR